MGIKFDRTPELFGFFHLLALFLIVVSVLLLYLVISKKDEKELLKILHLIGTGMLIGEVCKQVFCYFYVFDKTVNLWFFPWQLCSMAMYCSFMVTYVKGKYREALLVFLSTFSLLSGLIALLLPYDMLRDQILLFIHGFLYHGLMILEAMIAIIILRRKKQVHFSGALCLFFIAALIAELINVIAHHLLHDIHREPDMFYITPYYPSTQPVFHELAVKYGILSEIIIYLLVIALASYLLFLLLFKRNKG